MRKITGGVFQSLDGVMQAPGGPTEDPTGGFAHGGWSTSFWDDAMGDAMATLFAAPFDLLLGRKTWEVFAAHWPYVADDDPMGQLFGQVAKHVVTRSDEALEWRNSHRLPDIAAVAELRRSDGPDLLIQGSTTLYPPLLAAGLLDRLFVMTFPVVLGGGKRLFGPGSPALALRLVDQRVSDTGVVIATYEPDGDVPIGSFALDRLNAAEERRQQRMRQEGKPQAKAGAWRSC